MKHAWLKMAPPSYREHIRLSPTDLLQGHGDGSQLAELASAMRIATFLIDDIEQLQRSAVRLFFYRVPICER